MNVPPSYLLKRFEGFADRPAVIFENRQYSYKDLTAEIDRHYYQLRERGIQAGDVVCLAADYSFITLSLFLALVKQRAILVPVTTTVATEITERVRQSYVEKVVRLSGTTFQIESVSNPGEDKHDLIQRLRDSNAAGLVLFSSGTTGKPKAMIRDFDVLVESYKNRTPKRSRLLAFLMLDHIGGVDTFLGSFAMGMELIIPESRDPHHICQLVENHKVDILPATPTFLNLLLISEAHKHYDISSLKTITYGAEPMPESLLVRLNEAFPDARFLQKFGTSETGVPRTRSKSSLSTMMRIEEEDQESKIVNGELWLRSRTRILGYLNHDADGFTESGWFQTGDLAEEDEDGFIRIVGRSEEVINVGGQKVLPAEVETVVLELPEVVDCLVRGEVNAITGQSVTAVVVPSETVDPASLRATVRRHCLKHLDKYKVPTRITLADRIETGAGYKKKRV